MPFSTFIGLTENNQYNFLHSLHLEPRIVAMLRLKNLAASRTLIQNITKEKVSSFIISPVRALNDIISQLLHDYVYYYYNIIYIGRQSFNAYNIIMT